MARYEDLTIDQGSDVTIEVHLVDQNDAAKDLTGYSVAAKMAPSYGASADEKITFTGAVSTPATDGIITLSLTNAQTDALNYKKRYVYDVEISFVDESDNTIVERVMEGLITVAPSVTN
jgi:hypothetical protein